MKTQNADQRNRNLIHLEILANLVFLLTPVLANQAMAEDFETGDFNALPWISSGNANWIITSLDQHSGAYSARTGSITDNQTTTLQLTMQCRYGNISYWTKVSSESNDYLKFYIDGTQKQSWSGELPWTLISYPISSGLHTFIWSYTKDGSSSGGSDTAWIDDLVIPTNAPAPTVSSITPDHGPTRGSLYVNSITGSGFQEGALVRLSTAGQPDWTAKSVQMVDTNKLVCHFLLAGAEPGLWKVVITNPDGQGCVLPNAFAISLTGSEVPYLHSAGSNMTGQLGIGVNVWPPEPVMIENVITASAGSSHGLAIKGNRRVWAWGNNWSGQLGDGTTTDRTRPIEVSGLTEVIAVAAGELHSLAMKSDGTVWAWGDNQYGQLGDGTSNDSSTPQQVPGLTEVKSIAAGGYQSLALREDGTVMMWGSVLPGMGTYRSPWQIVAGATSIAVGRSSHSLAVMNDGTVKTWGRNNAYLLGCGSNSPPSGYTTPVSVVISSGIPGTSLTNVKMVAAGRSHSLALKNDGTVWAWGYGALGIGQSTYASSYAVQVSSLSNVSTIAAGSSHSLAMKTDKSIQVWGSNSWCQLGDGTVSARYVPVPFTNPALSDGSVIALGAGDLNSLAIRQDGTLWAWGGNFLGQLGNGLSGYANICSSPVLTNGTGWAAIASGGGHSVGLKSDGTVWTWGWNGYGQLGNNTTIDHYTPTKILGFSDSVPAVAVAAGGNQSFAVKRDGTVWAWGQNSQGQLGDGNTVNKTRPVQIGATVSGFTDLVNVAAGIGHTLALKSNGDIWAWGCNSRGQLGDGSTSNRLTPNCISALSDVVVIAADGGGDAPYGQSLAIKKDGTAWAWGANDDGQLGIGTVDYYPHSTPVQITSLAGVVSLAAAGDHSLAALKNGSVWAWGDNSWGQLGVGSTSYQIPSPAQVLNLIDVVTVVAGTDSSFGLNRNGSVAGWGMNGSGELANGKYSIQDQPVPIAGLGNIKAVAAGAYHTMFLGSALELVTPQVVSIWPGNNCTEPMVQEVKVTFSESVTNVSTNDLALSIGTVLSVVGSGQGPYVFSVTSVSGLVTAILDGDIADLAGNDLPSYEWQFTSCEPPVITSHPSSTVTTLGGAVTFSVAASDATEYEWQLNSCALYNDNHMTGVTSSTLQISNVLRADGGNYRCIVRNACGASTSQIAILTLSPPADLDHDGDVDDEDVAQFVACSTGPAVPYDVNNLPTDCTLVPDVQQHITVDFDRDFDVDLLDFGTLQQCISGEGNPADPECINPPGTALIPVGEFQMGNSFSSEGNSSELPCHAVYVDAFYMDRTEVTNQQYADALNWANAQGNLITVTNNIVYKYNSGTSYPYCDTSASSSYSRITWNGSSFGVVAGKETHPMVRVSWYGSVAYANWRSAMQGRQICYNLSDWSCNFSANGYRLPTEAEWEKAARGGAVGRRFPWSDSDTIQHARANYYSSTSYTYDTSPTRGSHPAFNTGGSPYTSPVGYFAPNGYGLYDMAGNVWEWCNDWYGDSYYSSSPYSNPQGPTSGLSRVLRGGGWSIRAYYCRVANGISCNPDGRFSRYGDYGFRSVITTP